METFKYTCEICVFKTKNKQHYNRHIESIRHKQRHNDNQNIFVHLCSGCNKRFKGQSGLYHHKPRCSVKSQIQHTQTQEKTQVILETVSELKDMLVDLKANQQPTSITNNHINNNNNINLILNENFTQAKNFMEMINGIKLGTNYPIKISSVNYVDTIVGLLKDELDKMPLNERPIHCIKNEDEHQKILHIRHENEWYKETELDWTSQIHNYYLDDGDEPSESEKKIIFTALQHMEEHFMKRINQLYEKQPDTKREYEYEVVHPPNKVRIIKYMLEYINMEREELLKIIEETYKKINEAAIAT